MGRGSGGGAHLLDFSEAQYRDRPAVAQAPVLQGVLGLRRHALRPGRHRAGFAAPALRADREHRRRARSSRIPRRARRGEGRVQPLHLFRRPLRRVAPRGLAQAPSQDARGVAGGEGADRAALPPSRGARRDRHARLQDQRRRLLHALLRRHEARRPAGRRRPHRRGLQQGLRRRVRPHAVGHRRHRGRRPDGNATGSFSRGFSSSS